MYTNYSNISLALAVWLAADDGYDYVYHENSISATTLLKPVRSVVLSRRLLASQKEGSVDLSDLVASRLGTAVHTAVESAWLDHRERAFRNLGIPQHVMDRIHLNAESEDDPEGIYIYMENRTQKEIDGWVISGKYDFVEQGRVKDIKTTKVYNWIHGGNDEKYRIQGSIYRWLNPEIITDDYMEVIFMFTDWSPLKAQIDKTYPQRRVESRILPLMSLEETEAFVRSQISKIAACIDKPQEQLPRCTPEELWMDPPTWAYYKDRSKMARATKLFDNATEANQRCAAEGGKGIVVKREAEPTFCKFCDARPACTQAEEYINAGILQV